MAHFHVSHLARDRGQFVCCADEVIDLRYEHARVLIRDFRRVAAQIARAEEDAHLVRLLTQPFYISATLAAWSGKCIAVRVATSNCYAGNETFEFDIIDWHDVLG
jgi:hypothetical protein